ncbi:autotransporter outer membrane beta-barrel domain-containing protein [Sutterella sp. AM11-39]|jgi:outer membrane autotransporter protein|uniref:autotransporter outer membrane beta-barrel domain-containing protein n=1 Tax=Sutterella sp. AM11-39 TaxID=2292075 RepID=UPI000E50AA11|nr:autotransporter outer membrane beta-barrel domain-containing protein [Sutterella sp. AM11-39]RHJ32153.1 autotransporter outer membrane beta-barrel domain-containing protein [Sutterella sp. AM11-39]
MLFKTQIALAVGSAFIATSAFSSVIPSEPEKPTYLITNMSGETQVQGQLGTQVYDQLLDGLKKDQTAVVYSQWKNAGGTSASLLAALQNGQNLTNEGTIWVLGGGNYGNYAEGMGNINGVTTTLTNKGTIYVKSDAWFEGTKAMGANEGATIINNGTIVVEGGVGMYANSNANGSMVNCGTIEVKTSDTAGVYSAGMSWNKENADLQEFKNAAGGRILVDGERAVGVWAEDIKDNSTFENAGSIIATNGGTAITASKATNFTLALSGDSHIEGKVALNDDANITATGLTSTEETLDLVNSNLGSLTLENSTLGFTGDGALSVTNYNGDSNSSVLLKDNRTLTVTNAQGNVVITSDHTAETGKLVTISNVTGENSSVSVNFTNNVTDTLASADDAADLVRDQISVGGKDGNVQEAVFDQGSILGEITVDADGNVTAKSNTNLDAYRSVHALAAIGWRNEMNDLTKRMGELRDSPAGVGTWARMYGSEQEYGGQSVTSKSTSIQVGADYDIGYGWKVGGAFTYTDGDASYSDGSADADSYGFAVYGTWLADNGQFVDLIAKYNRMSTDFTLGTMNGSYDNNAWTVSAEYGWHLALADLAFVEPQVELTYGQILGDDFSAANGVTIEQDDFDSLIGRIGVRGGFYFPENKGTIYLRASVLHDFQGEMESRATNGTANARFFDDLGGTWYEVGVGGNFNLTDRTYTYVDLEKNAGGEVKENWRWNVGIRHVF